jgi:AcrR family transcriptional regulator
VTETVGLVKPSRSGQAGREARLLEAAARLFAHFGFDKTSVDDIAREAGVSKGAVYLHWPSKDALFDAALAREGLRALDDLLDRLQADPAGGSLAAIYRHSLLALSANPLLHAAYRVDARVLGSYIHRQNPAIYRQRLALAEEFVRRMQAAGLMRADLEPSVTAYLMGVLSFGLLSMGQLTAVPAPSFETLATALADLVERGLAAPGGRGNSAAGKDAFRTLIEQTRDLYLSGGPLQAPR